MPHKMEKVMSEFKAGDLKSVVDKKDTNKYSRNISYRNKSTINLHYFSVGNIFFHYSMIFFYELFVP